MNISLNHKLYMKDGHSFRVLTKDQEVVTHLVT